MRLAFPSGSSMLTTSTAWRLCARFGNTRTARIHRRPLAWAKTDHAYPATATLQPLSRELAEILVSGGYVAELAMARLQDEIRSDQFLADLLVARGLLSEEDARLALSQKTGVQFSKLSHVDLNLRVAHVLPRHLQSQFGIVPVRVENGKLLVAGTRVPGPEFYDAARVFTALPIEFHLISNENFLLLSREELATESLRALHNAIHEVPVPDSSYVR